MKKFSDFIREDNQEKEDKILFPDGVYVSVRPSEETTIAIQKYQEKYLKGQEINQDLHCTIIYSQKPQKEEVQVKEYKAIGTFKEFNLFGPDKNVLVAEINSPDLIRRNKDLVKEYNFISDFDEYKSHITLVYNAKNIDINSLPSMDFAFILENESVEALDTNYANKENEKDTSDTIMGKALSDIKKEKGTNNE